VVAVGPGARDEAGKVVALSSVQATVSCSANGPALRSRLMAKNSSS
jgi:hypothetical protein